MLEKQSELDNLLANFEEDLKLIPTYNTLGRQEASRRLSYDLARKALQVILDKEKAKLELEEQ